MAKRLRESARKSRRAKDDVTDPGTLPTAERPEARTTIAERLMPPAASPVSSRQVAYYQVMERAWLIMAFIGVALSEHPLVRQDRTSRQLVDRAKEALIVLHSRLERRRSAR